MVITDKFVTHSLVHGLVTMELVWHLILVIVLLRVLLDLLAKRFPVELHSVIMEESVWILSGEFVTAIIPVDILGPHAPTSPARLHVKTVVNVWAPTFAAVLLLDSQVQCVKPPFALRPVRTMEFVLERTNATVPEQATVERIAALHLEWTELFRTPHLIHLLLLVRLISSLLWSF